MSEDKKPKDKESGDNISDEHTSSDSKKTKHKLIADIQTGLVVIAPMDDESDAEESKE